MIVNFTKPIHVMPGLVSDAELIFEEGEPLEGMKLVGFSLRKSHEGEMFVTGPSRAFGAGTDRRYFEFLRSTNPRKSTEDIKAVILNAWGAHRDADGPAH